MMGAFRNNQRPAPNPYSGSEAVPGFWGLGAIGGMTCQQAADNSLGDPDTETSDTIITQVIDWPFAEDDAEVAFDQANLYGVRTRCWRLAGVDGGGDRDSWTAVPKTLPIEYTAVGRCGIQAIYADYLGANPLTSPVSWNHRTPTSPYLLDTGTAEGLARSQWTPMNYNQEVLDVSIGDVFTGQWAYYSNPPNNAADITWIVASIATSHVGFRGGKLVFTLPSNYAGVVPISGSFTLEVIAISVLDTWDPFDEAATSAVVEVLDSHNISWSFTSFADPPTVINITLGDLRPADVGIPYNFYIRYAYDPTFAIGAVPAPVYGSSHVMQLSPRTDVPLWYFASTRNKVAPGGIIQPPP